MMDKAQGRARANGALTVLGLVATVMVLCVSGPAGAQFSSEGFTDEDGAARAARTSLGTTARPSAPLPLRKPAKPRSRTENDAADTGIAAPPRKPATASAETRGDPPGPRSEKPASPEPAGVLQSAREAGREGDGPIAPPETGKELAIAPATLGHEIEPERVEEALPPADEETAPAETLEDGTALQEALAATGFPQAEKPKRKAVAPAERPRKKAALPPRPRTAKKKEHKDIPKRGKPKTREQQCAALTVCRSAFARCRFSKDRNKTDDEGWEIHKKKCGAEYQTCIGQYFEPGEMFFTRWFLPYNPCS